MSLIDCDSMQVRAGGKVFHCTVAKGEYLAPELQGKDLATTDRTPESDNFALAVLLFLMLMEGDASVQRGVEGRGGCAADRGANSRGGPARTWGPGW